MLHLGLAQHTVASRGIKSLRFHVCLHIYMHFLYVFHINTVNKNKNCYLNLNNKFWTIKLNGKMHTLSNTFRTHTQTHIAEIERREKIVELRRSDDAIRQMRITRINALTIMNTVSACSRMFNSDEITLCRCIEWELRSKIYSKMK